ncbi:AraC family transcriptional regulator [Photobacterium japonica]|uniref:helix-turn-helix domain-containing protein n=1 Tax=Photobacterium japonica TaxID=2910235 RepID=UPI003D11B998
MKPSIENVLNNADFNWMVKQYHCKVKKEAFTCSWHYHAEYELVLYRDPNSVLNARYFAGDDVGQIRHNSLLLYGPGLPHMLTGAINGEVEQGHYSIILWFRHQWIEALQYAMPELNVLKCLLQRSAYGLQFSEQTAEHVFQLLGQIDRLDPHHQLLQVLRTLTVLSDDQQATTLSVNSYGFQKISDDDESIKRVDHARKYIEKHYAKPIKIRDLCQHLHMSESSAYRLFERHFQESFSDHLKRFRVGKSCELLVNSQLPVSIIAERSGFNNLSNFNRHFKTVKGITPSVFRAQFK